MWGALRQVAEKVTQVGFPLRELQLGELED